VDHRTFAVMLTLPAVLFVAALGLWPLADFLLGSVAAPSGGLTGAHYRQLLSDDLFIDVATRTTLLAAGVAAVTVVLAYPLAYRLMRQKGAGKGILIALVALPYLTSVLVRVYAWEALLALNGPVNGLLLRLGLFSTPQLLGHSLFGTTVGMVHILCPIAVLTLWPQLEKTDPSQRLVAESLGASHLRAFLTVFLPQSLPGLAAAGSLVYVLALGAYVIPAALGGTKGLLFAQLVVDQATQLLDWEAAGAMGVLMLAVAAVPILLFKTASLVLRRWRERGDVSRFQDVVGRHLYPLLDRLPVGGLRVGFAAAAGAVLIFFLVPELVVLVFSFGPEKQVSLPPPSWSFDGYRTVLSDPGWRAPAERSIVYAVFDALIATLCGTLAAYGFARGTRRWGQIGAAVLLAPLVLPEIVVAISFFVFATKNQLAGTDLGIILGQAVGTIGLVAVVVGPVVGAVDVNLEYAAQACGASRLRAFRDVVVPLIMPGIIVGFLYGFLHALDNLVTPLFIAGTRSTITVRMFLSMQEQLTSVPAVIASLLIFALVVVLTVSLTSRRGAALWVAKPAALPEGSP